MKLVRFSARWFVPAVFTFATCAFACGSGESGAPGVDGKDGTPGSPAPIPETAAPTINLVEPRVGLVARSLEVTIATSGKVDMAQASVSFGEGVEVVKTAVAGNALVATIEIAPDAPLGKRDVVLKTVSAELSAKAGFVVGVPLSAKVTAGKAEPGGLVRLDLSNQDKIAFDPENFALVPLAAAKAPSLVGLKYDSFTATDGSVVLLGDPLTKAGPLGFVGVNDPNSDQSPTYLTAADAVTVSSRQPESLTSGIPVDKTFAAELQTAFFAADVAPATSEGLLVEAWARVPADSTMTPLLLAYPKSGTAADLLAQAQKDPGFPIFGIPATEAQMVYPVTEASKAYFVVLDAALGHGPSVKMSFDYRTSRAQIFKEKTDAHASGDTAQNIGSLPGTGAAVPARVISGALAGADEVDVYKFTGLSAVNATDMLVSVVADVSVVVRVDTVPTFDSESLVEITQSGKTGMGATSAFVGQNRFIQVTAADPSAVGKYTLGIKRTAAQP